MKKRVYLLLAVFVLLLSLTGCAGKTVVLTNPEQAMSEVCERNIAVLNTFRNQGLISEAQYSNYVVALRTRASTYIDLIKKAQQAENENDVNFKATLEMLQGSLVHRFGESKPEGGFYGNIRQGGNCPDNEDLYYLSASQIEISYDEESSDIDENIDSADLYEVEDIDEFKNLISGSDNKKYAMTGKGENAKPLIFIDENNLDSLIKEINRPVYVLDENKLKTDEDWKKLVEALNSIKQAELNSEVSNDENYRHLRNVAISYFKPTNKTVYHFKKEDLIKISEDNSNNLGLSSGANEMNKDVIINGFVSIKEHRHSTDENGEEECDITDTAKSIGVYSLRVQEFDGEFYKKVSQEEYTNNKYITLQPVSGDEVGVALLMEYPVAVIDSLEAEDAHSPNWHFNFKDTDMRVNIYNGEMLVRKDDGTCVKINSEEKEEDKIYRVFPANVGLNTDKGKNNSFTPYGSTSIDTNEIVLQEANTTAVPEQVNTVRFALKDYLELTYMEGIINDENFIATGRRITFEKFSGSSDESIGYYTDKLGDKFLNGVNQEISVMVSNLVDYTSGNEGYYEDVAKALSFDGYINIGKAAEELNKPEEERAEKLFRVLANRDDGVNIEDETGFVGKGAMMLPYTIYMSKINPVLQFTSSGEDERPGLDAIDADNDKVAPSLYYGVCLNTNVYTTGLFTTWINTEFNRKDDEINMVQGHGGEGGSLRWWNNWLASHHYQYSVNIDKINSRLSGIYAIDLAEIEGKIIFDESVIRVINQEFQEDKETTTKSLIKTFQVLAGIIFLVYGFFMMACWLIDTNLVNGPGFLTIISFGKLVAIRDSTEVPRMVDGKIYADFKYLCISTVVFCGLGILLILFDIQDMREVVNRLLASGVEVFKNLMLNRS